MATELQSIQGDGDVLDQVRRAVAVIYGKDREVVEITEDSEILGRSFPQGSRSFMAIAESSECTHAPRCRWYYAAYCYLDRCVVLDPMKDGQRIMIGEVIRRLTEEVL
jgi:hypothetical protein